MSSQDQLTAFNEIVSRLSKFDEDVQRHILIMVSNWFNFPASLPSNLQSNQVHNAISNDSLDRPFAQSVELTPKEFLVEKEPLTNIERIACLAYYLTHYRNLPHFKTLDISKINTEAAQPKFTNATVSMNDTTKAGFIVGATKSGQKQLSALGEQFVLALPNRDEAKLIQKKMVKRKRRKLYASKAKGRNKPKKIADEAEVNAESN